MFTSWVAVACAVIAVPTLSTTHETLQQVRAFAVSCGSLLIPQQALLGSVMHFTWHYGWNTYFYSRVAVGARDGLAGQHPVNRSLAPVGCSPWRGHVPLIEVG